MYEDCYRDIENNILSDIGSIPVTFQGLSHTLQKNTLNPVVSKHDVYELIMVRSGKLLLTIGDQEKVIDKGSTVIIKPNVLHSVNVPSGTTDVFVVYFTLVNDAVTFSKMLKIATDSQPPKVGAGPSVNVPPVAPVSIESFIDFIDDTAKEAMQNSTHVVVDGTYKKDISRIVEWIVYEQEHDSYSKGVMMQLLTHILIITIARSMKREWEESIRVKNGKAKELVLIAKEYIDQNFDRGITVSDVASYVFLSQGYFTRAFREEFGISPMGYLMNVRIMKACDLLEDNEIKVSAIALQTGFASPQRFNVAFRNHMGMTPLEYRKLHLNKE